ncbi:uncharacterized protein LOC144350842 [Saccoglossus kowalevskii]
MSDLSLTELKLRIRKEGLCDTGSKKSLVTRLQRKNGSEVHRNWLDIDPNMSCRKCLRSVPSRDTLSHLDDCWFTRDGSPDVYLLHVKSGGWAVKCTYTMLARSSNPARRLRQILHTVHANPGFINLNIKSKATNNSAHRVEYKLLDEMYAKRTAELMTTTMIDTPLKQYLNVSPSILHQFYQILVSRAVEHGVTGIAVDTNSNTVVGVTLGFVITSDSDLVDNVDDFPELQVMQPNIAIVAEVRKRVFKLNETKAALASGKTVLEITCHVC